MEPISTGDLLSLTGGRPKPDGIVFDVPSSRRRARGATHRATGT